MAKRDKFHNQVRRALEKEGWSITDDPLELRIGGMEFEIDLGAEKIIGAEKDGEKIAVEIKTFMDESLVTAFHKATGQYDNYLLGLEIIEPERKLYLAIPSVAYDTFFQRPFVKMVVERKKIKLIIYQPSKEIIVKWVQ
jgi:XisH protein